MHYYSTRNKKDKFTFEQVFLHALAADGGLYIPESIPVWSQDKIESMRNLSFQELSFEIFKIFTGSTFEKEELASIINHSYSTFKIPEVIKSKVVDGVSCVELFHGPTLAFKDVAMQVLGNMYQNLLSKSKNKMNLVTATSGDTGAAAIDALKSKPYLNIFVLHPENKVSETQRRLMTSVADSNVFNIAIQGTFDDCQYLVKEMFNDTEFRNKIQMSGVNSINWARIVAQIVYYFYIYLKQSVFKKMVVSVPTGNFGDIYAGYVAKKMGLPIEKLIIASNHNNLLENCIASGLYKPSTVKPSISPSMDIQVASNFERIVFDICEHNDLRVKELMQDLKEKKQFQLNDLELANLQKHFLACSVSEEETKHTIAQIHKSFDIILDPHSAIGFCALKKLVSFENHYSYFCLETAHPCKFPDAIHDAIQINPPVPSFVKEIFKKKEKFVVLNNDLDSLKNYIISKAI